MFSRERRSWESGVVTKEAVASVFEDEECEKLRLCQVKFESMWNQGSTTWPRCNWNRLSSIVRLKPPKTIKLLVKQAQKCTFLPNSDPPQSQPLHSNRRSGSWPLQVKSKAGTSSHSSHTCWVEFSSRTYSSCCPDTSFPSSFGHIDSGTSRGGQCEFGSSRFSNGCCWTSTTRFNWPSNPSTNGELGDILIMCGNITGLMSVRNEPRDEPRNKPRNKPRNEPQAPKGCSLHIRISACSACDCGRIGSSIITFVNKVWVSKSCRSCNCG